jgi:hypothetical protein
VKAPPITVHNTSQPSSTIEPYPLPCPPGKCSPGTNSDDNGVGSDDGDGDDSDDFVDNDWEEEEDDVCVIDGLPDRNGNGIGDVSAINGTLTQEIQRVLQSLPSPRVLDGSLNYSPVGRTLLGRGLPSVPRPTATPVLCANAITCYNVGLVADASLLTQAIDTVCGRFPDHASSTATQPLGHSL